MLFIFPKTLINCMYKFVIHNLKPMFTTKKNNNKKNKQIVLWSVAVTINIELEQTGES